MGPLAGVKVLEIEAIGPVPWTGMMLADMGADVLRVDRPAPPDMGVERDDRYQLAQRGRRAVIADLKTPGGVEAVLHLVSRADVLIEGMRPGVMERLGLGPDACFAANPALVYGRMTGWGQEGPLASAVGHDINYIGLAGVLGAIGTPDRPPPVPLNLVGDYGGGGMLLAYGVLAALLEARQSGQGQVVDAAMIDGSLSMMAPVLGRHQGGEWLAQRGANLLDGGAPFYATYTCADGKFVAVGAIEPRFYRALLQGLELDPATLPAQMDRAAWPPLRARFTALFLQRTRDQWCERFEGTQACVTPVLLVDELPSHPHLAQRGNFVEVEGVLHPAPAPRLSRTPGAITRGPVGRGVGGAQALSDWGFTPREPRLAALHMRQGD